MTGSGRLRDGCGSTTVRVTALIGQNISSRLHCGEGNWGQIHLSCFPGPESNGSSLRSMFLLLSGVLSSLPFFVILAYISPGKETEAYA